MNKHEAYVLGAYLTDGTTFENSKGWKQFRLEVRDESFANAVYDSLTAMNKNARLYERKVRNRGQATEGQPTYDVYSGDQELCNWLENSTLRKQHVPTEIAEAPKALQLAFLAGVMDGDGFICWGKPTAKAGPHGQWTIGIGASGHWVSEVRYMMQGLGVKVGKMKLETKNRKTPLWRYTVNKPSFVSAGLYFQNQRKQERLQRYINTVYRSPETTREAS